MSRIGDSVGSIRLVPLGGLGEIGLNLMVLEYAGPGRAEPEAAIAIDCGVMFPSLETPGIDLVIPDLAYLFGLGERLLGVFLTHGHEDHVGALPFLLRERDVPVYGSEFTLALLAGKLTEHRLLPGARLVPFRSRDRIRCGPFEVEPVRMTHSIPDAVGFAFHTPVGTVVHTGDFKIDHTPVDGETSDLARLAELGAEGVLLLLSDSTNADRPGTTPSERSVASGLDRVFRGTPGKILATTFASHVHRIQQLVDFSEEYSRQLALAGRSLLQNVETSRRVGRLRCARDPISDLEKLQELSPRDVTLIVAGSQGEPRSALSRIATGDHRHVTATPGDAVLVSARVIPGNERAVGTLVNHLYRRGARVHWETRDGVHVSGHASQEELKLVLRLVRPRFFVPVHGEYRHLVEHVRLAEATGVETDRCFLLEDGQTLRLDDETARREDPVDAGRVFVDGKGVGDVEEVVLRDRRHLAQDGVILAIVGIHAPSGEVVAGPDLLNRGVLLEGANPELLGEAREAILRALGELNAESRSDLAEAQETVRRTLKRFFGKRLDRRPMILPWIVEM